MARISLARARSLHALVAAALLSVFGGACATPDPPLTAADAEVFLADAEARLLDLWSAHRRAAWVRQRFETDDTAAIAAAARRERLDGTARLAHAAARFDGAELPESLRRKMHLLRTALAAVGPAEPGLQQELSDVLDGMRQMYYRSAACTMEGGACLDRPALERLFNSWSFYAVLRRSVRLKTADRIQVFIGEPPLRPLIEGEVEAFLAVTGLKPWVVGYHAIQNTSFIWRLRRGARGRAHHL